MMVAPGTMVYEVALRNRQREVNASVRLPERGTVWLARMRDNWHQYRRPMPQKKHALEAWTLPSTTESHSGLATRSYIGPRPTFLLLGLDFAFRYRSLWAIV